MNNCVYCSNLTKGKICSSKECLKKYKKKHYHDNIEKYREKNREERKRNFSKRKDIVLRNAKKRYYSDNLNNIVSFMFQNARSRAKKSLLEFNIDKEFLFSLFELQNNKCALTNLQFKYNIDDKSLCHKRPFAASLDRIDCKKGYTKDNVRLVCIIVNFALCEFGDQSFDEMCMAYVKNKI